MKSRWARRNNHLWRTAPGVLLLTAGAVWVLLLARLSYTWHVHYRQTLLALSTLEETNVIRHPITQEHLFHFAASLLGVTAPAASAVHQRDILTQVALHTLHALAKSQWLLTPALWAIGFMVMGVALYWIKEGRLGELEAERTLLKEKMLAIARGWASLATNPDGRHVMDNILAELTAHTAVSGAAIYRLTGLRSNALEPYAAIGELPLNGKSVPGFFLEAERGLIGESLATGRPVYSGDFGESGYLLPGTRLARVAVFPARYRDHNWGILLLSSEQSGWFYAYRDVLEILAQEVALAAAAADVADQARQHQLMEDRARMQSDILANVSHELRTPLGLVRGYLETLVDSGPRLAPDVHQEFLAVSLEETRELETLIDNLLTMRQIEDGAFLHHPEWFDTGEWLNRVLARHPDAARQRIRLVNQAQGHRVFGDPRSLTTVLSDLLENALKYSPGAIDVSVESGSEFWSVSVRDFGPGVSPMETARVFERFFRAAAHAKSEIRGSGLGLSIAKHIVDRHGGAIHAENVGGGGFRVRVTLPAKEETGRSRMEKEAAIHGRWRVGAGR